MATNNSTNNYGFTSGGLLNAGALNQGYMLNLGLSYSAGILTIKGANGSNLSATNPAYITVPSNVTPGKLISYTLTANQTLQDSASGASWMVNNSFGTSVVTSWNQDMPFYLYAAGDSTDANLNFFGCRIPNLDALPVAGKIAKQSSAVGSTQGSVVAFSNPTVANFASSACVRIGYVRVRRPNTTDWTFQTLSISEGLGKSAANTFWVLPAGVNSNASGKYAWDNGGTAPNWNLVLPYYKMLDSGLCMYNFHGDNNGGAGTAGAGAGTLFFFMPYLNDTPYCHPGGGMAQFSAGNPFNVAAPLIVNGAVYCSLDNNTTTVYATGSIAATVGYAFQFVVYYNISTA